jgi:hypothetical protein
MSTGKLVGRAALALGISALSFAFVLGADDGSARRTVASGLTNSVVVESQTLIVGIPGSTVGVSISNSVPIAGFLVPLEIRPLTPGASIAQTIEYRINPTGRVANSPLGYADPSVDSLWPEASRVTRQTCVTCSVGCSGPTSNSYCTVDTSCVFPTNPYGLFFGTVSTGDPGAGELIELEPGADPGTPADASLQIILNQIGPTAGVFEIDTACWLPANSIAYALDNAALVVPTFTKGVIELVCDCGCHADIVCDGVTDLLDVVTTVDIIFRGEAFTPESFCPYAQVDVNCDGVTDIQDVVIVIEVAFRGGDAGVLFCDPCAP